MSDNISKPFQIVSDGACDLGLEAAKRHQIELVPFYVTFDGQRYVKEEKEMKVREIYQKMKDLPGTFPKTSLPTAMDYIEAFKPYVEREIPILCICLSAKFTGSYNSAQLAKEELRGKYPGARIEVIDSTLATVLQGSFVLEAARMRDQGISLEETVPVLEQLKKTGRIFFTIDTMEYLAHGGRAGKVLSTIGAKLPLKPLIVMKEGELFPSGVSRSRRHALHKVIHMMESFCAENHVSTREYRVMTGYGYDREECEAFSKELAQKIGIEPEMMQIGATIGVHTGPDPIGTGLIRKFETI